jgi:hypothetical protein
MQDKIYLYLYVQTRSGAHPVPLLSREKRAEYEIKTLPFVVVKNSDNIEKIFRDP